ncbi:hypothetical protein Q7P37_004653 [Cladosporium fusiforme]
MDMALDMTTTLSKVSVHQFSAPDSVRRRGQWRAACRLSSWQEVSPTPTAQTANATLQSTMLEPYALAFGRFCSLICFSMPGNVDPERPLTPVANIHRCWSPAKQTPPAPEDPPRLKACGLLYYLGCTDSTPHCTGLSTTAKDSALNSLVGAYKPLRSPPSSLALHHDSSIGRPHRLHRPQQDTVKLAKPRPYQQPRVYLKDRSSSYTMVRTVPQSLNMQSILIIAKANGIAPEPTLHCTMVIHKYTCGHTKSEVAACAVSKRTKCGVMTPRNVSHNTICLPCGGG